MRQQHSDSGKLNSVSSNEILPGAHQMIMADSVEVMGYYYKGKIQELEQSLTQLNLLDHAKEIATLCKEIIRTKALLQKINKGTGRSNPFSIK